MRIVAAAVTLVATAINNKEKIMAPLLKYAAVLLASAVTLTACSDSSDSGRNSAVERLEAILDFESYTWQQVAGGKRWDPRAGLQVLEQEGRFYLMGGRTPPPPTTFPMADIAPPITSNGTTSLFGHLFMM